MYLNRGFVSIKLPTQIARDLQDIVKDWRHCKILIVFFTPTWTTLVKEKMVIV